MSTVCVVSLCLCLFPICLLSTVTVFWCVTWGLCVCLRLSVDRCFPHSHCGCVCVVCGVCVCVWCVCVCVGVYVVCCVCDGCCRVCVCVSLRGSLCWSLSRAVCSESAPCVLDSLPPPVCCWCCGIKGVCVCGVN
ncbi:hypothetical protein FKM82_000071 [Ascaphus truei]